MRILVLSPVLPHPPTWGFVTRVYQFLRLLASRHSVSLLTYSDGEHAEDLAALRSICADVHSVPIERPNKRLGQAMSLFSPMSYQWRSHYSARMQQQLTALTTGQPFDVIQVESSQVACFDFDRRAVLVIDEHNIEYELLYRAFLTESSTLRRAYNWVEFRKFRREEISAWRRASGVATTSAREAEIIRGIVNRPARTVPNGVDVEYFSAGREPVDPNAIVMTGLMKYRPNVDAAVYFVREVLPRIVAVRPGLVFYVVGGEPSEEVKQLAGPNVVVTGTVPDVRPYVRKAAVFVVPLRMGSGTRLKVLEGLSMEKAMVSTSLGCEGIDVEHNRHLLIADDASAFAAAVLRLLDDPGLATTLATAGRDLVEARYRWESVVSELESFYGELLDRHRAAPAS
jgi:sugar transferase (PEP-CTERM/EpsH1 system associated)